LERLPKLKLISQRSVYPHIDIETCTKLGIVGRRASSERRLMRPPSLTGVWFRAARRPATGGVAEWKLAVRRWPDDTRQDARHMATAGSARSWPLRQGVRHEGLVWAREPALAKARADGSRPPPPRAAFLNNPMSFHLHMRLVDATPRHRQGGRLARMKPSAILVQYQPRAG